jgi:hypothetical protein
MWYLQLLAHLKKRRLDWVILLRYVSDGQFTGIFRGMITVDNHILETLKIWQKGLVIPRLVTSPMPIIIIVFLATMIN